MNCTTTPHDEDRVGHERTGLGRGYQRNGDARQIAGLDSAIALTVYPAAGSDVGRVVQCPRSKSKQRPSHARAAVLSWRDGYPLIDVGRVMVNAMDLASDH